MPGDELRVTPLDIGQDVGLFGVLTEPVSSARDTAFILLNAGLVHRVGPYRMHVEIARALATAGFPTLRIDQSGKGDSGKRIGTNGKESAIADVIDCVSALRNETDVHGVVIGGWCCGSTWCWRWMLGAWY